MKITKIKARQVLDSRGNPTIECEVFTEKSKGSAIVPSGASTGKYEALELRDKERQYHGKSVYKAINNIHKLIAPKLIGKEITKQQDIDNLIVDLDGTPNKSNLGANATLAVSLAVAVAASNLLNKPLYKYLGNKTIIPIPFCNIINGGRHSEGDLQLQEFMIVPIKAKSFSQATQMAAEIYYTLKQNLDDKYGKLATHVGDEGGFAPPIKSPSEALDMLSKAIEENNYTNEVKLAIDAAASEFYTGTQYKVEPDKMLNSDKLIEYYKDLIKKYPIISLEDPFDQDDFSAYKELKKKIRIQIVGDDLLATNKNRIEYVVKGNLCNCLLLKLNQIGTLTEALEAFKLATKAKWKTMISHRSGETEDTFIADLAVALGCGQIKLGAPCRGERTAKFNRLLKIEEDLGKKAKYAKF
ncbi:phosphopyruvate hydratase [Candidatus Woesearchaeota archaeon]|nr:phosphopyruvate hydratase [Candidatus Woesearchaeota archaeon]